MWHPSRAQWVAIAVTVLPALFFWIAGGATKGDGTQEERFALSLLVVGGLVVWYLGKPKP